MKILCLIDSLGSGGAQRQLCTLAVGLKKRGHEVRFLVYHPDDHFLPLLQEAAIPCQVIPPCSYAQRVLAIRRILRQGCQDVVLAFLEASSLYAELAGIPGRRWALAVGERSANPGMAKGTKSRLRQFHRFADAVVCNSHTNRLMLEARFPFLKQKLATVYNTVDLDLFTSDSHRFQTVWKKNVGPFRIVVAASYQINKNVINVASALNRLKIMAGGPAVVVDWFGGMPADRSEFDRAVRYVDENGLGDLIRLHPATRDIAGEYAHADAIGLFSFFEGLPNVVCEGMACGKPVLASNVCDASNLVRDGENGFLCDPGSPPDIAEAILKMAALSKAERMQMGLESRRRAELLFAEDRVVERYEDIASRVVRHDPISADCSWPPNVPLSALRTVERWVRDA